MNLESPRISLSHLDADVSGSRGANSHVSPGTHVALSERYPQLPASFRRERYRPCYFGAIFTAAETRPSSKSDAKLLRINERHRAIAVERVSPIPFSAEPIAGESLPSFRSHTVSDNQPTGGQRRNRKESPPGSGSPLRPVL